MSVASRLKAEKRSLGLSAWDFTGAGADNGQNGSYVKA